jgi:hypothetical protein
MKIKKIYGDKKNHKSSILITNILYNIITKHKRNGGI